MPDPIETTLAAALSEITSIGQVLIQRTASYGFTLRHRDDHSSSNLKSFRKPEEALEIARFDDTGVYRPLKTAPNLRHGWRLDVLDQGELRQALEHFYPGRLAMLLATQENRLATTPLRDTLNRQSGMYRVAAKISDQQINDLVGCICRSDGGCLRTILWKRDANGAVPSTKLPLEKFDPAHDQAGGHERAIPLLCQEACSLLVAECRKAVKDETNNE